MNILYEMDYRTCVIVVYYYPQSFKTSILFYNFVKKFSNKLIIQIMKKTPKIR